MSPLCSPLQLRFAEVGDHPLAVDAEQIGDVAGVCLVLDLSLLVLEEWIRAMQRRSLIFAVHLSDCVSSVILQVIRVTYFADGNEVFGHVAHVHHGGSVFEHLAEKMSNVDIIFLHCSHCISSLR